MPCRLASLSTVVLVVTVAVQGGCAIERHAPSGSATAAPRAAAAAPLFDAMPFAEWRVVGGAARFELLPPADGGAGPTLVGRGPIERNGFLASPRALHDFRLSVEVRLGSAEFPKGEGMNSGIQIRSGERDGTVAGLQIEIDSTERRWSGGVYDERGRGWLAPLNGNPAAMAAFRLGEWNLYEIECVGPRIRTRVNGVDCAEWYDGTVSGLLAFQVHGGKACEVAFRAPVVEETGRHAWRDGAMAAPGAGGAPWSCALDAAARGVRLSILGAGAGAVELRASDGEVLATVPIAAKDAAGSKAAGATAAPRTVELVWIDGKGAALLDGARVAELVLAQPPAGAVVVGDGAEVRAHAVLERADPAPR